MSVFTPARCISSWVRVMDIGAAVVTFTVHVHSRQMYMAANLIQFTEGCKWCIADCIVKCTFHAEGLNSKCCDDL